MLQSDRHRRKGAIALGYDPEKNASPKVIAKGYGKVAEKIYDTALQNDILIKKDPALFDSLAVLEPGDEIPVRLYKIVAELLVYVYRVNGKLSSKIH